MNGASRIPDLMAIPHYRFYLEWRESRGPGPKIPYPMAIPPCWFYLKWRRIPDPLPLPRSFDWEWRSIPDPSSRIQWPPPLLVLFKMKWNPGSHAPPPTCWSYSKWMGNPGSNGHPPCWFILHKGGSRLQCPPPSSALFKMKANPGSNIEREIGIDTKI